MSDEPPQPAPIDFPSVIRVQPAFADSIRRIWDKYHEGREEVTHEEFKLLAQGIANKAEALAILLRLWAYPPDADVPMADSLIFEDP